MTLSPLAAVAAVALLFTAPAQAQAQSSPPEPQTVATSHSFDDLLGRLRDAIKANKMGIVAEACASCAAKGRGVEIPGNAVVMAFRNDFAVRMLKVSIPAGIEAPLRFYVTEEADGTAMLRYPMPSAVFAPYGGAELQAMAAELDTIWQQISRDAVGQNAVRK